MPHSVICENMFPRSVLILHCFKFGGFKLVYIKGRKSPILR